MTVTPTLEVINVSSLHWHLHFCGYTHTETQAQLIKILFEILFKHLVSLNRLMNGSLLLVRVLREIELIR